MYLLEWDNNFYPHATPRRRAAPRPDFEAFSLPQIMIHPLCPSPHLVSSSFPFLTRVRDTHRATSGMSRQGSTTLYEEFKSIGGG